MKNWIYYNHAALSTTAPHETVDIKPIKDGSIWKMEGFPLFARWTTDWDCNYETDWWYVIKDSPFDIAELKAKRRYEINKGKKNFEVKRINPEDFIDELTEVQIAAFSAWPEKYRPTVDKAQFRESVKEWKSKVVYGGFSREDNRLCAYSLLNEHSEYLEFNVLRTVPEYERLGINAAMVVAIVEDYNERLGNNFYINDGSRSIRHETAFQDYLEKYFGFRKAYCKLNIKYRFPIGWIVKILFPFSDKIKKDSKFGSLISAVLEMEKIRRNCN